MLMKQLAVLTTHPFLSTLGEILQLDFWIVTIYKIMVGITRVAFFKLFLLQMFFLFFLFFISSYFEKWL